MRYLSSTGRIEAQKTDCLVTTRPAARALAVRLRVDDYLDHALADFDDKPGKAVLVPLGKNRAIKRVLIVGSNPSHSVADFRKAMNAAATTLKGAAIRDAVLSLDAFAVDGFGAEQKTRVALAILSTVLYRFKAPKRDDDKATTIGRIAVRADGRAASGVRRAIRVAQALDDGMRWARDMANLPPNVCNPTYLARVARAYARANGLRCRVLEEAEMERLGMGAFMSVTRGSDTPGKLIIVEYRGGKRGAKPIAMIGKGITFDTGGISLKPGAAMDEMKFDMCGAASVLGCLRAAVEARLPVNLLAIVAAAENMPSGNASRPGDVVTTLSGQTVEILNTDAEGRLVLCDAITYSERYEPQVVIDVATLTGACVVALGAPASGLFANDDALAKALQDAGDYIGDRAWRMPVWEDYQPALRSNFADMANIGGREAGAITAACFLSRFARKVKWAHLDIAGSAYAGGAAKGASGRPVPLLFQYLLDAA